MALDTSHDLVAARHAIWNAVYLKYARGMDRNDNQSHGDAFFDEGEEGGPGGIIHSASFHGNKQALITKGLGFFEKQYSRIRHPIHNHFIHVDLARGKAVAETYFHDGYICFSNADNSRNSRDRTAECPTRKTRELIGRYSDELECRNGVWKFTSRTVMFDFSRIDPIPDSRLPAVEPFASTYLNGARLPFKDGSFKQDPSFAVLVNGTGAPSKDLAQMLSRFQIERLVTAWTRQLDRWIAAGDESALNGLVSTYFAPDATVHDGTASPVSVADYLAATRALTTKHGIVARTSVCSNHTITIDPSNPSRATGEVYIDLHLNVKDLSTFNPDASNKGVPGRMWFAGRHVDNYVRGSDGIWRFAKRAMILDWARLINHDRGLAKSQADAFQAGNFLQPSQDPAVKFLPDAGRIARQPQTHAELEKLLKVQDALHTYTRGIDRADMGLVGAAYHKGAIDDHGPFKGTGEEFVAWASEGVKHYKSQHHGLTNILVDFTGEKQAKVESRVVERAYYLDKNGKDLVRWFAGRYLDVLEEREGVWRIASRVVVLDWSVVDPMVEKPTQAWAEMFPIGKSDKTDLTYQTFAKFEAGKSTRL